MTVFHTTALLFSIALALHILIWKLCLPHRQMLALGVVFALVFCAWMAWALFAPTPLYLILHTALYYMACSFCYLILYTTIEGDSPTLSLMHFISQRNKGGISMEEVDRFLAHRPFVSARLSALIKSGLVVQSGGKYRIAGQPPLFFRIILGFRKLYGPISEGG
ncbi:MAG: hypothetical protein PHD76_11745 [Methylacidiphilales bacterium]|nr:hypothetical protein [Candidatus Methylacidiphilales bacterium]